MNPTKLLNKIREGHKNNVSYKDFLNLIKHMSFVYSHTRGSHEFYTHPMIEEHLVLQNKDGEAKPYQISQVMDLVDTYNLTIE